MDDLTLYIAYHEKEPEHVSDVLVPIDSGRTDAVNIGTRVDYCELRAQYWVWKNGRRSEYVGFFHPRRYLAPGEVVRLPADARPLPYEIRKAPDVKAYAADSFTEQLKGLDVIAPVKEYTGISVRQRYSMSRRQRGEDLELVRAIIGERYPAYAAAADEYLNGCGEYYGNIYIMRWAFFQRYCAWLFDILAEYDERAGEPLRQTDGLLGERLFGIYFTWLQGQEGVRCGELPRLLFSSYDDGAHRFKLRGIVNSVIPPGSERRAVLNRIRYRISELWRRGGRDGQRT